MFLERGINGHWGVRAELGEALRDLVEEQEADKAEVRVYLLRSYVRLLGTVDDDESESDTTYTGMPHMNWSDDEHGQQ